MQLTSAGSNRQYYRETRPDGSTYIRVVGTNRQENHAFITLAQHFRSKGLPVPEVYMVSEDEMEYTQEDLGDVSLFDYIRHGREIGCFSQAEQDMLQKVVRLLPHMQIEGAEGLDWDVCYPVPAFDRQSIFWDCNYFKYCYLKAAIPDVSEPALERDFTILAERLLAFPTCGFMYRDFQSRNIMLRQGMPYCIDFQGGRKGPVIYDIVSFLWQAKANIPARLRDTLIDAYIDELSVITGNATEEDKARMRRAFYEALPHFVLFRLLQVLGAYGFRGYFEHKPHFLQSIPAAIRNLHETFTHYPALSERYPTLHSIAVELWEQQNREQGKQCPATKREKDVLCVTVYSFSYKKGIPADESGNGGGYVFDCRSTHNPGKYDAYKTLTGRDKAVIDFLEQDGEITAFLEHVYALIDRHIERYIERGFTHLQIAFGCTGGQHRSVYSAESTARHIHEKYHLPVRLMHREQQIEECL